MHRLSSLLVVSCALLSTFALPSICSPSSSSTSFVVAAPSNALFRDSALLAERLNRILLELNSVLDSEDRNEDEEEQEELADEQEVEQSASEDPLEDLTEGNQIVGTINEAEAKGPFSWRKRTQRSPEEKAARTAARKADFKRSRSAVNRGLRSFSNTLGNGAIYPAAKIHQYVGKAKRYLAPEARAARKAARKEKSTQALHDNEYERRGGWEQKHGPLRPRASREDDSGVAPPPHLEDTQTPNGPIIEPVA